MPGVGAKALRALSLVAELTYGAPASVRDPVSYSFALELRTADGATLGPSKGFRALGTL